MFCPDCGTLGFMQPDGNIRCTDYKCGYEGPLSGSDGKGAEFTDPMTGEIIDLSKTEPGSYQVKPKPVTPEEITVLQQWPTVSLWVKPDRLESEQEAGLDIFR